MDKKTVKVQDKCFELFVPEAQIQKEVSRIAREMNRELSDKDPIFLGILNGAFMFASDLYKQLTFPCQITFLKLASYSGTKSTGSVKQLIGINRDLKDRVVVVLEEGEVLAQEALLAFCEERMPYFAVPRYVEFVASLPKTPNEKIQKSKLRAAGVTENTWDRDKAGYRVKR